MGGFWYLHSLSTNLTGSCNHICEDGIYALLATVVVSVVPSKVKNCCKRMFLQIFCIALKSSQFPFQGLEAKHASASSSVPVTTDTVQRAVELL